LRRDFERQDLARSKDLYARIEARPDALRRLHRDLLSDHRARQRNERIVPQRDAMMRCAVDNASKRRIALG
jgi:hypothetical protein